MANGPVDGGNWRQAVFERMLAAAGLVDIGDQGRRNLHIVGARIGVEQTRRLLSALHPAAAASYASRARLEPLLRAAGLALYDGARAESLWITAERDIRRLRRRRERQRLAAGFTPVRLADGTDVTIRAYRPSDEYLMLTAGGAGRRSSTMEGGVRAWVDDVVTGEQNVIRVAEAGSRSLGIAWVHHRPRRAGDPDGDGRIAELGLAVAPLPTGVAQLERALAEDCLRRVDRIATPRLHLLVAGGDRYAEMLANMPFTPCDDAPDGEPPWMVLPTAPATPPGSGRTSRTAPPGEPSPGVAAPTPPWLRRGHWRRTLSPWAWRDRLRGGTTVRLPDGALAWLRPGRPDDIDTIASLYQRLRASPHRLGRPVTDRAAQAYARTLLTSLMPAGPTGSGVTWVPNDFDVTVVAEHDGEPVGAAWLKYHDARDRARPAGFIGPHVPEFCVAVDPARRATLSGLEEALARECLRRAAGADIRHISAAVHDADGQASLLLERLGFRPYGVPAAGKERRPLRGRVVVADLSAMEWASHDGSPPRLTPLAGATWRPPNRSRASRVQVVPAAIAGQGPQGTGEPRHVAKRRSSHDST